MHLATSEHTGVQVSWCSWPGRLTFIWGIGSYKPNDIQRPAPVLLHLCCCLLLIYRC